MEVAFSASGAQIATGNDLHESYEPRRAVNAAEDQADVVKVLAGDISAFEGIVRRWQGPLINLAFRYCREHGRAEELAQEAFLRVYRSLNTWRKDASFSTWLFAVAANLYRSELKRIPANTVPLNEAREPAAQSASSTEWEDRQRERSVRNAVLALPFKYREVLTLFYFHEMDIRAAAQSLGLPDGTVKARLSRGREMLRKKLDSAKPPQRRGGLL